MFDIQFVLMAGATLIGFVNALPPRLMIAHLKSARAKAARGTAHGSRP